MLELDISNVHGLAVDSSLILGFYAAKSSEIETPAEVAAGLIEMDHMRMVMG